MVGRLYARQKAGHPYPEHSLNYGNKLFIVCVPDINLSCHICMQLCNTYTQLCNTHMQLCNTYTQLCNTHMHLRDTVAYCSWTLIMRP